MRQSIYIFLFFYSIFPAQQSAQQLSSERIFKKIALTIKNRNYLLKGQFFTVQKKPIIRYAKVLSEAGWGYIDTKGIEVIPPKYDLLEDFRDGIAKFSSNTDVKHSAGTRVNEKIEGIINISGKELILGQDYSRRYGDSLFTTKSAEGNFGLVHISGKTIFPHIYKGGIYGTTEDNKIFSINNGNKYAFARYSGEKLTSFIYDETYAYGNALFGYIKGKGHYLIHAVSGIKSEIIFDEVNDNRNASPVKMLHGKKVLIDKNGKLISKFYDDISAVENSSLYRCELGVLQGLLDKKGNEVMPPCLRCSYNISSSEDGVIRSFANPETKDYDYFYYDENYQLINTGNKMGRILQNGILTYEENGKIGAIDTNGKIIVAPIYTYLDGFSAEHLSVAVKIIDDVEKYGVINSSGNTVVPFIYDFIRIEEREKKIAVYKKYNINEEYGRVGFLSYTGAEILPTEYSSLTSAVTEKLYYGKNITKDVYQVIDLQKKSITNVPSGRLIELYYLLNHSESLVSFAVRDGRFNLYGFKDINGNLIIPAKYIDDVNFINGLAVARTGDFEIVWMDTFGNQVKADSVQQKFGSLQSDDLTLFKLIKNLYEN